MPGAVAKKKKPVSPWRERLKSLREKYGLTQAEAAEKTGVALRTWISWENSHRQPSGPALRLLKYAFPDDF